MALSTTTYALSKKYTDKSIEGLGAIKGAPCTIKSTTETSEGTEVVFEWTGTGGTTETKTITIKNGVSITDIEINSNKHLICTMSDGSTIDAGEVPNVKGDTGFSPTIEENPNNTDEIYKLDITNESGTFTTPNLKGTGGGLDPDRYYDKTQVDALIEPLNEAKHTHENKENVLDKLTTNATGDTLLFKGQEISSVKIDDTTTTAADKVWSAKKINDTIDAIKAWADSEESLAIKTALYNNNTLMFYKKPNATVDDIADFSINLPEEQFLDQAKTTFINNFIWSEELYPNSTNPNLDNEPVLVLAVKGDTDVVYSFVSMNELVKIYKASTTVSTVTLTIDDAANTISAKVNISADEGNLLKIGIDGGLYAKVTVDNALSDTSENPVQNKVINVALNSKANTSDLSDHTNNADIHVTAAEKASWNGKAELTDIPTTLPANGGNADTVDGFHASDIQIDSVSDTAELVTLDGLQGGVPFSNITVSGKNLITEVLSAALGGNSTDGFRITDNPYCRSFVQKLLPNTTYTVKRYDNGNRFRIILFNEYPTITADTTANQILNATTTPNEWTFTTGTDHLWFALTTHNGATDNTVVEPIVQLEYGDTATTYEEPIIGQEITLTTCGKNLIPYPYIRTTETVKGITFTDNGDGTITIDGTATDSMWLTITDRFKIPKNIKYTFSCGAPVTAGNTAVVGDGFIAYMTLYKNIDDTSVSQYIMPPIGSSNVTFVGNDSYAAAVIRISRESVIDNIVIKPQLEVGEFATEYEPYSGSVTTITPDSNPYTVPNDIRQQEGINSVSVSVGKISVTGVKKNTAIKKIWDNKADLSDIPTELPANGGNADTLDGLHASDIQIDSVSDTAGIVTLDGLQGGVPFSNITVSSKNLIPCPYENNVTRGGITFVLNDDGTISMSGTATEVSFFNLASFMDILLKKGITYTLSTGIIEGSAEQYDVALVTKSGVSLNSYVEVNIESNKKTFTPEYDIECRMLLRVLTGNTVNCTITAMLELGDNSTGYERPIVGKEITLTACGKNLLKYPYAQTTHTSYGVIFTDNGDGSITASGTHDGGTELSYFGFSPWWKNTTGGRLFLPKGNTVTFRVLGLPDTYQCMMSVKKDNTSVDTITTIYGVGESVANYTAEQDCYVACGIYGLKSSIGQAVEFTAYPQLELGDTATAYEPYHGAEYTITPDINPYTVPNDIRQQEGINNMSVSAGEVSVTGVKKSPVINRAWEELDSHTNNTTVHVTAEEKAAWNGKFDYIGVVHDLFAVDKTCVCAYDMNTLNTPFSSGLTLSGAGLCFVNYVAGAEYATYLVISSGDTNHYAATSNNGSEHVKWHKISDGGNADTLDGKHASDFYQLANGLRKSTTHDATIDIFSNITPNHISWNSFTDVETNASQSALENAPETTSPSRYHVWTYGESMKRGHQIAVSLFSLKVYIRYLKDSAWSDWKNIADGGNADTVNGKHAVDIMNMGNVAANRTLIEENTNLNTMRVGGKFVVNSKTVAESCRNTPFTESGFYFDVVRHSKDNILQIATLWTGKTKIRNSIDAASWNEWVNINDGGNADTVDGLHANEIASNPNLLINPNFKINQRGQSEYTGSKNYLFTVDCWRVGFGNGIAKSLKVESDGVVFGSTTDKQYLVQLIENAERLIGDYTLTFCVSEITGSAVIQFVENNVASSSAVIREPGVYSVTITLSGTGATVARRVQLQSEVGSTVKVRWAKLESGSIATPFCSPNPATELAKCQRYYEILTIPTKTPIIGVKVNNLRLPTITYSVPKRIETPTVVADEAYPVRFSDNAGVFGDSVKKEFTGFSCTSSSMTGFFGDMQENKIDAGQMGYIADPVKIIINAEL